MNKYQCDKCLKLFTVKGNYKQHLNRITPCVKIINNDCIWCNKKYVNKYTKLRHEIKTCPVKIRRDNEENEKQEREQLRIQSLEDKITQLENMIKSGITPQTTTTTNTNTNTNNSHNPNSNNIIINNYGSEDMSHITEKKLIGIFNQCFMSVPKLIELKHFNKEKPENSNVYISDIKSKYALIHVGDGEWNITDREKLLDEMYNNNCNYLADEFEERHDNLDDITSRKIKRFLDEKDDDETTCMIKDKIKELLFNNKDHVKKIRTKIDTVPS
jgi:hypothetical protein